MRRAALPVDAFWARVEKTPKCWLWTGPLSDKGYGLLIVQVAGKRTKIRAHRFAYELLTAPKAVTTRVNVLRGSGPTAVAARRNRCIRGHRFDRVVVRANGNATRRCSTCERSRSAA